MGVAILKALAEVTDELSQLQDEIAKEAHLKPMGEKLSLTKRKVDAVMLRLELIGQSLSYN